MKVRELEGRELDAWVAKALGWKHLGAIGTVEYTGHGFWCLSGANDWWETPEGERACGPCCGYPRHYSTEWEHGGPIIENHKIILAWEGGVAFAGVYRTGYQGIRHFGDTTSGTPSILVAAMRCLVASSFGEEVP